MPLKPAGQPLVRSVQVVTNNKGRIDMSEFKYQHGLSIMRAQPFHIGHQRILNQMLQDCRFVTIILGSTQEYGTSRNPFDFDTRRKMIENIYPPKQFETKLQIFGLYDINNTAQWPHFVLDFLAKHLPKYPRPDAYYAGSEYDAHWFESEIENICLVDRNDENFTFVSATMVREMIKFHDHRWKDFVPAQNHQLIEDFIIRQKGVL